MVRANASSWKYQTTLQTSDPKLLIWQLRSAGTRQTQMTSTISAIFYSIRPNNPFDAAHRKKREQITYLWTRKYLVRDIEKVQQNQSHLSPLTVNYNRVVPDICIILITKGLLLSLATWGDEIAVKIKVKSYIAYQGQLLVLRGLCPLGCSQKAPGCTSFIWGWIRFGIIKNLLCQ